MAKRKDRAAEAESALQTDPSPVRSDFEPEAPVPEPSERAEGMDKEPGTAGGIVREVADPIVLVSPHGGPAQLGTADDPIEVDARGRCTLDRVADAQLVNDLLTKHGFREVA